MKFSRIETMPGRFIRAPTALLDSAQQFSAVKAAAGLGSSGDDPQTTVQDTPVYFWYLTASSGSVETTPSNIQGLSRMRDPPGDEAVVNVRDGRTLVDEEHFRDRTGKYRGTLASLSFSPVLFFLPLSLPSPVFQ